MQASNCGVLLATVAPMSMVQMFPDGFSPFKGLQCTMHGKHYCKPVHSITAVLVMWLYSTLQHSDTMIKPRTTHLVRSFKYSTFMHTIAPVNPALYITVLEPKVQALLETIAVATIMCYQSTFVVILFTILTTQAPVLMRGRQVASYQLLTKPDHLPCVQQAVWHAYSAGSQRTSAMQLSSLACCAGDSLISARSYSRLCSCVAGIQVPAVQRRTSGAMLQAVRCLHYMHWWASWRA